MCPLAGIGHCDGVALIRAVVKARKIEIGGLLKSAPQLLTKKGVLRMVGISIWVCLAGIVF